MIFLVFQVCFAITSQLTFLGREPITSEPVQEVTVVAKTPVVFVQAFNVEAMRMKARLVGVFLLSPCRKVTRWFWVVSMSERVSKGSSSL